MEKLFITPKRKSSHRSNLEPSPENKRLIESNSPPKISSDEQRGHGSTRTQNRLSVIEAIQPGNKNGRTERSSRRTTKQGNVFGDRSRFSKN